MCWSNDGGVMFRGWEERLGGVMFRGCGVMVKVRDVVMDK